MKTSLLVIFLLMIPVEASARVSCLLPGVFCVQAHHRHHKHHRVKHKKTAHVIVKNVVVKKVVVKKIVRPAAPVIVAPTPTPEEPKRFYFF